MVRHGVSAARTPGNLRKIEQARQALAKVLEEGLQRGFYGELAIRLTIQDGTIQQVRRQTNRMEK